MKEKWSEYKSDEIPKGNYEVTKVLQDTEGTTIELKSENYRLTLKFGFVDALRIVDEGRRIRTYHEISEIQTYRENFYGIPLYQVADSEFCEWLALESSGFYSDFNHYAIMTINDIVDIAGSEPPIIQVSRI